MEIEISYKPNDWAMPFHTGDWKWGCCVGGLGSGKSVACIEELKACALENPGFTYLIGRKTFPSLRDTTMKTFFQRMEPGLIKDYNQVQANVTLVNNSRFIFRPLDDPEKLKSLEIAGWFINEANEIPKSIFDTLKTRTREKINGKEPTRYRGIIDLNPVDEDHWIPQHFVFTNPPDHQLFQSTTMDNVENLPEGYLDDLKNTYSEAMQARMIWGQFTKIHPGRPVFPQFKGGSHVVSVEFDPKLPVIRGWDFGYNHPCVVWCQLHRDQLRVLGEKIGNEIYLDDFIKKVVMPYQAQVFGEKTFIENKHFDFCDPHGADQSDKGRSSVQIMNQNGIYPIYRRTFIEEGLKALMTYLGTVNDQKLSNLLVHPRCVKLIEGFQGGYRRADGEEDPLKDGTYDHYFDALRYAAIHVLQRSRIAQLSKHLQNHERVYVNPHTGRTIHLYK